MRERDHVFEWSGGREDFLLFMFSNGRGWCTAEAGESGEAGKKGTNATKPVGLKTDSSLSDNSKQIVLTCITSGKYLLFTG